MRHKWKHSTTATGMHRVVSCYGPPWKPRTNFLQLDASKKKKIHEKFFFYIDQEPEQNILNFSNLASIKALLYIYILFYKCIPSTDLFSQQIF